MAMQGRTTTWGTHIGAGRATETPSWYAQMKAWWATHKAARHDAKRAALNAHWEAKRETVRSYRADAAIDMVPPAHLDATARALCELSL
jgi:hypothetical protein